MMRKSLLLGCCGLLAALAGPAPAKIIKTARPDCQKSSICFYWWPELPALPGWHADDKANFSMGGNGINVLIPDGATFENTEAVIYGNAVFKGSLNPRPKTLADFIAGDAEQSRADSHGEVVIAQATALDGAKGTKWRSVTYFQPNVKVWERVAFGEEGDYYIVLTLRSRTLENYKAAQADYEKLVRSYAP
jgi:hypothetical protein